MTRSLTAPLTFGAVHDPRQRCLGYDEAFAHAADMACGLASRTVFQGHVTLSHYVEIANHAEERVGGLCFGDAVEVRQLTVICVYSRPT